MIKNRKLHKAIALFFVSNILLNVLLPVVSFIGVSNVFGKSNQINEGVTPPNLVDLKTGDMNYNIPLIDLPGGYSFQLYYHSGIRPMENASWVGLGWQLGTGEISRTVNGYPDDYTGLTNENYFYGNPLPSSPNKQFKPYGCLQGYKMTAGRTVGSVLPNDIVFDTYTSHYPDNVHFTSNSYRNDLPPPYTSLYEPKTAIEGKDTYFGGSFPNYDGYSVYGGGMNGQMQPLILENPTLYSSSRDNSVNSRSSYIRKLFTQSKPCFRFINDFSNSYTVSNVADFTPLNSTYQNMGINFGTNQLGYQSTIANGGSGYRSSDMRLAGSKHVEYYTNSEIADQTSNGAKSKGFIGYEGMPNNTSRNSVSFAGGVYAYNVQDQIGGYSITDASGNTYHYALPVYEYKRYSYNKTSAGNETAIDISQAYAYKWLLTSITAYDFVDKNNNGYADESDLGNWTNFVYGRWTDQYDDRSPILTNYFTENGTQSYSTAKKEVYYLDAAYTRSHAVLFPKDSRLDAFVPPANTVSFALKLNAGILFTTDGIRTIRSLKAFTSTTLFGDINSIKNLNSTSGFNTVLDIGDLQNISTSSPTYATLIVKESRLNYDYSVCYNAPNTPSGVGKLALKSLNFYGKNASMVTPSYDFFYELGTPKTGSLSITFIPTDAGYGTRKGRVNVGANLGLFAEGDILKFTISSNIYYATLVKKITTSDFDVVFLGVNIPGSPQKNISISASETKNPPYTDGYYDVWGNFKSDYDYTGNPQNKGRKTSVVSAVGTDVWSLRRISTPTGADIEIEYESDSYSEIAASEGKRVLNIHPNIGFVPVSNQTSYSSLVNDGTYYFGLNFRMNDLNRSLSSHNFKLRFLENDATHAILYNIVAGQTVKMATMSNFYSASTGDNNCLTKNANVTVVSGGFDSYGAYMIVTIPRNDLGGGPFVDANSSYTDCVHFGSYLIIGNKQMLRYGGGVRVKSVSLKGNTTNSTYKTSYNYLKRGTLNTSGSISYDPSEYDIINTVVAQVVPTYPYTIVGSTTFLNDNLNSYKKPYSLLLNNFESIRYFVPPTGVKYEFITVNNDGNGTPEKSYQEYQYEVYRNSLVKRVVEKDSAYIALLVGGGGNGGYSVTNRFSIKTDFKDHTSKAGTLVSIKSFDADDKLISKQVFNYSNELNIPGNQGVIGQVFHEQRNGVINYSYVSGLTLVTNIEDNTYSCVNNFHRYPTVLLSTETTDYLKGISNKLEYKSFDIFNGSPSETITSDSYGNFFKNITVPAYQNSISSNMGLKMFGKSNMLSQVTEDYTYKVNPANYNSNLGLMSASTTLWGTNNKYRKYNSSLGFYEDVAFAEDLGTVQSELVFKPLINYDWNSPKVNADGSYNSFVAWNPSSPDPNWKPRSELKISNPYSGALSWANLNGQYGSKRLTKKNNLVLAEVNNSNYNSFTYTSFEDFNDDNAPFYYSFLDGEVSAGFSPANGVAYGRMNNISGVTPHTGNYVCMVVNSINGSQYTTKTIAGDPVSFQPGKTYRASVWVHESSNIGAGINVNVNGTSAGNPYNANYAVTLGQYSVKCGSWYLLNLDVPVPADYISSGGTTNKVVISLITGNGPSGGTSYFDDFSFHAIDSDIKGYVYDESTWLLNYVIDKDNFYSRYEYDNNKRLKAIYKETINGEVKIKDMKYNFVK